MEVDMGYPTLAATMISVLALSATPLHSQTTEPNNCVPTGIALTEQANGSFTPSPYSLLPNFRPAVPKIVSPVESTVVEGNLGRFLPPPGGSRENYVEARFSWDFSATNLIIPLVFRGTGGAQEMRTIYLGNTTHYELCIYETNPKTFQTEGGETIEFQTLCENPDALLSKQREGTPDEGVWAERVDCQYNNVAPHPGSGFAQGTIGGYSQTGFKPYYPYDDDSIVHLAWKMRACNVDLCSGWSDARTLVWVPPPKLDPRMDKLQATTTSSPNRWYFVLDMLRVVSEAGFGTTLSVGEVDARFCVAEPGESCTVQEQKVPGRIWVKSREIPDNTTLKTEFLDNNQDHGRTSTYWFLNGWKNWTGATCWHRNQNAGGGTQETYCVYQDNYEIGYFGTNTNLPD